MATKYYIESVGKCEPVYFIKCDGGYYTKYASKARDVFNKSLEFGDRLVANPAEHCMVQFSQSMALSKYGEEELRKVESLGFINPRFALWRKGDCTVLIDDEIDCVRHNYNS